MAKRGPGAPRRSKDGASTERVVVLMTMPERQYLHRLSGRLRISRSAVVRAALKRFAPFAT